MSLTRAVTYEETKIRLDRMMPRNAVRKLLTDHAEHGGWELMRLRRYRDGTRDVWIRRKVIKARSTLDEAPGRVPGQYG